MLLKVVFFGGKGGVGKSTLACATALKLSERRNTLLVSIDPAHSLSGILGLKVGESLKKIEENLYAIELNGEKLVEDYANKVLSVLGELIPSVKSGLFEYAKYLKHSPTALETAILDRIGDYLEGEFSFVVVDSAPTGQIIRLFYTLNNLQGWFSFLERVAKEKQKVDAFMGREDKVFNLVRERKEKVERLIKTLKEKAILFAVANEEPLSLEEAKSLENSLKDFRVYKVINKWKSMEGNYLRVSYLESPYGIEKLYSMELEDILKVILTEA